MSDITQEPRAVSIAAPQPGWLSAAPAMFLVLWSLGFPVAKIGIGYTDPITLLEHFLIRLTDILLWQRNFYIRLG